MLHFTVIKSWQHKGLKKFYLTGDKSGIMAEHAHRLKTILQFLDAATSPNQLNLPSFGYHKLKGEYKNFYAITVRSNWRIIFGFDEEDAILVNYLDYH